MWRGAELLADALFGDPKQGTEDQSSRGQADTDPGCLGDGFLNQLLDSFDRYIRGE
jgi:hypothetical protein